MNSSCSSSAIFSCNVCGKETKNNCSNCKQIYYCCVEHQKQNWKAHKNYCHPFKMAHNEDLGRHLITTRNIKPEEIVLKEVPLLRGPNQLTPAVCLGCLNSINPVDYINCAKCGWPLCGTECAQKAEHYQCECELTVQAGKKVNIKEFSMPQVMYQCITTLRGLMLQYNKPELWSKLNMLESLEEVRRGSMQWQADYESVCSFILKFFNTHLFHEDDIMRVLGILQINGYEIPTSDPPHVAIYYTASFLEHSCTPNLAKSFNKEGQLILWSPKMIKKGTHLSICYTDALWATADRQRHLMQTKIFKCNCERCLDVTEYGTKYSALKCEQENCAGLMLPRSLNDWHKNWICEACNHQVDKAYVNSLLDRASSDFNAMEKTKENCLKYLKHYQKWLPREHFYMNDAKMLLIQKIGYDAKDLMQITHDDLHMKLNYTKELIKLYKILAPCEVRLLGSLYFEMHSSIAEHARRLTLETKLTNGKELLEESLMYVEKCCNYLQYESNIFIEGHILKQARMNRDALKLVLTL